MSRAWIALGAGADAADELLARFAPELVLKAPDPLNDRGFLTLVRRLARELADTASDTEAAAVRDAFDALDVNWPALSADKRAKAIAEAEAIIGRAGAAIAPTLGDVFAKHGTEIVASTKGAAIGKWELPIAARLTGQDERIVQHAASSQALYVTDQYGTIASGFAQRARDISAAGLKDGLSRTEIGADMFAQLGQSLGRTQAYFVNVASIHLARGRTFAQLSAFEEAEIEEWLFSAVVDEATCFAPGTRVTMASGHTKHIENVFGGDMVMSCKGRPRRVLRQIEKTGRKWYTFQIEGQERKLTVTHNHGLLTSKGWMRACSVGLGDELVLYRRDGQGAAPMLWSQTERDWMARPGRFDGRTLNDVEPYPNAYLHRLAAFGAVRRIWASDLSRRTPAFDLEVEDDFGYVAEGCIVHNSPICRMLDGKRFSTRDAMSRYKRVAESPPEAVKTLQPFVQQGVDENGHDILYYKDPEGARVTIAQIDDSGVGRRDDRGKFSKVTQEQALAAAGIGPPPLHGHCRSLIVPA